MIEFLSVKLQTYSVQTATLVEKELTTDSFWNMCRKLSVLKRIKKETVFFLRKKSMMDQRLNKFATLQYTIPNFIKNGEPMSDLPVEVLKVLTGKTPTWSLFFTKLQVQTLFLQFHKKGLHHIGFPTCVLSDSSF